MVRSVFLVLLLAAGVVERIEGKVYHRTKKTCPTRVLTALSRPSSTSRSTSTLIPTTTYTADDEEETWTRTARTTTTKTTKTRSGKSTSTSDTSESEYTDSPESSQSSKMTRSSRVTMTGTSTAEEETSTGTVPVGGVKMRMLFPVAVQSSWTTSTLADSSLPLSDKTLRPSRVTHGTTHNVVKAPDGKLAMEAIFLKGSVSPGKTPYGGFSFYAYGASDLTKAKEALFSYSVWFEEGFQFNKGGKMPGFYGGNTDSGSVSCSGGRKDDTCFSVRLMWRTGGTGELYTYLPPGEAANKKLCKSGCDYGASVGRGSFQWETGAWNTVAERVKLNDVGQANGEVEIWFNGKSVINLTGIVLCISEECSLRGLQCQTFFGGHESDWASPKRQSAYFADWSVGTIDSE